MEIVSTTVDDVVNLEFKGTLDAETAPQAQGSVQELLKTPCSKLLIDLGGLEYISSAGIRVLLLVSQGVRRKGGRFAVYGARGEVKDVIEVSGLAAVLGIVASREEARALLGASPP